MICMNYLKQTEMAENLKEWILMTINTRRNLEAMPFVAMVHILHFLDLYEIVSLQSVSKTLYEQCSHNAIWRMMLARDFDTESNPHVNLEDALGDEHLHYVSNFKRVLITRKQRMDTVERRGGTGTSFPVLRSLPSVPSLHSLRKMNRR